MSEPEAPRPLFDEAIELLMIQVESLREALPAVMSVVEATRYQASKSFREFIEAEKIVPTESATSSVYSVRADQIDAFRRAARRNHRASVARAFVPRSFLVSLVSVFDAYLGRLIRAMFDAEPGLLNASEHKLEFTELVAFGSIDEARAFVVEKEVESVLRASHAEQFKWLENKLKIPLRQELEVWPTFIEVTERRNLFVHSDGVISSQYLKVCREHKCGLEPQAKAGHVLQVGQQYFSTAAAAVLEIGIKLGQVIWRKLKPDGRERADSGLTNTIYALLGSEEYDLAIVLSEFATKTLKKHSSEQASLTFVVNLAQAYKWAGRDAQCREALDPVDWSAKSLKFRLAKCVLLGDFAQAEDLMRSIGASGELLPHHYRDWPLFKQWRDTEGFRRTYRAVFAEDLPPTEETVLKAEGKPIGEPPPSTRSATDGEGDA